MYCVDISLLPQDAGQANHWTTEGLDGLVKQLTTNGALYVTGGKTKSLRDVVLGSSGHVVRKEGRWSWSLDIRQVRSNVSQCRSSSTFPAFGRSPSSTSWFHHLTHTTALCRMLTPLYRLHRVQIDLPIHWCFVVTQHYSEAAFAQMFWVSVFAVSSDINIKYEAKWVLVVFTRSVLFCRSSTHPAQALNSLNVCLFIHYWTKKFTIFMYFDSAVFFPKK